MTKDDAVPVTAEDRALFKSLFVGSPDDPMAGDTIDRGLWDKDWRMLEIARHRGGTAGVDVEAAASMLANIRQGRSDTPRCEPPGQYAIDRAKADVKDVLEALASLSQTPATPMVQEGLREAQSLFERKRNEIREAEKCCGEYVAGSRCPACPDRTALSATPAPPVDETDRLAIIDIIEGLEIKLPGAGVGLADGASIAKRQIIAAISKRKDGKNG